jgi:hypothetical protein
VVIADEESVEKLKLTPLARIVGAFVFEIYI